MVKFRQFPTEIFYHFHYYFSKQNKNLIRGSLRRFLKKLPQGTFIYYESQFFIDMNQIFEDFIKYTKSHFFMTLVYM